MGIKLIVLLAVLVGVLYSLHLLVQDYQALTAPRLLRLLFKRDLNVHSDTKPYVRWKRILFHDPLQCARYLYCDLGAQPANNEVRQGFVYMLTLEPRDEEKSSHEEFNTAYHHGKSSVLPDECRNIYTTCPFPAHVLFELIQYLLTRSKV